MFEVSWLPAASLLAALALFFLATTGLVAWALFRRFETLRGSVDLRLDELSRRMRLIEGEKIDAPRSDRLPRPSPPPPHSAFQAGDRESTRMGPTLIAIPDLAEPSQAADPQVESDLSARHAEVWALAATGASPEEIARQTGQPVGQVELIVGLYRQVRSSKGPVEHARSI
jgi:hypothetical protein